VNLNKNWSFKASDSTSWNQATVPGVVHLDLLNLNQIEDPFYGDNEKKLQWIDKKKWEYKTTIIADKSLLEKDKIELHFKGLDTYASITLNNKNILNSDNMFREFTVDCKDLLKEGNNELYVLFKSPAKEGEKLFNQSDYFIKAQPNDDSILGGLEDKTVSPYTRKAGYHYGWDWGPRFLTSGVWRPIYLNAWSEAVIRDVFVQQTELTNEKAELLAEITVEAVQEGKQTILVKVDENIEIEKEVALTRGENIIKIPFEIKNPKRWWPNGMGDSFLYDVQVGIENGNSIKHNIGLRTIELVTEKDSIGESFYFKVNGHRIFAKGANTIPFDNFLPRVSPERYEDIIKSAADANMNMLRVWGGGIYEDKAFYEMCDKYGILVWQDFMFACSFFPGTPEFLENVKQEAIDNVIRLRNHPSIALWCGNNEIEDAWKHWGWNKFDDKNEEAYKKIFLEVLPKVVDEFHPQVRYWSSSPSSGSYDLSPRLITHGDTHYWQYRQEFEPISVFKESVNIPRFLSETGFQSFPEMATMNTFLEEKDYDIYSEVMKSHQKSFAGNKLLDVYMLRHYKAPKDFEATMYLSQVMQKKAMKVALEAYRRAAPYCMGALYWQLNDTWPAPSWSSIDYYGRWKAMNYDVKRIYSNIVVSPDITENELTVHLISDHLENQTGQLALQIIDVNGKTLWEENQELTINANTSTKIAEFKVDNILKGIDQTKVAFKATCKIEGKIVAENTIHFVPEKELKLQKPELKIETEKVANGYEVKIASNTMTKEIFLSVAAEGRFSENYFDVMAGQSKTIFFETEVNIENFKDALKTYTLTDSFE
tara:strand:+ start:8339 stop:10804 length:2466 start_codon:yes stop_codon:yes gene_type:complete